MLQSQGHVHPPVGVGAAAIAGGGEHDQRPQPAPQPQPQGRPPPVRPPEQQARTGPGRRQEDGGSLHKETAAEGQRPRQQGGWRPAPGKELQQYQEDHHGQQVIHQPRPPGEGLLPDPPWGQKHQGQSHGERLSPAHRPPPGPPGQQVHQGPQGPAHQQSPEDGTHNGDEVQLALEHPQQIPQVPAVLRHAHNLHPRRGGPGEQPVSQGVKAPVYKIAVVALRDEQQPQQRQSNQGQRRREPSAPERMAGSHGSFPLKKRLPSRSREGAVPYRFYVQRTVAKHWVQ